MSIPSLERAIAHISHLSTTKSSNHSRINVLIQYDTSSSLFLSSRFRAHGLYSESK